MRTYDQVVTYGPDHAAVYNKIKVWYRNNAQFGKFYWQAQCRSYLHKRSFAQNIFDTSPNVLILRFLKKTHIVTVISDRKMCMQRRGRRSVGVSVLININGIGRFELTIELLWRIEIRFKPICGSNDKNYFENRTILSLFCAIFS